MGSRYALREVEVAIGYDCRRLDGGRRALFRHTGLHKRARRNVLERRDLILALSSSYMATSSLASNPRMDVGSSIDVLQDKREALIQSLFPYFKTDRREKSYEDYDKYFDELDELDRKSASERPAEGSGKETNDIIKPEK